MSLSNDAIKKIAHLARLNISDEQITTLSPELDNILTLITKMNQVNTDDVAPLAHPLETNQPLRTDVITEHNQRELFQRNAPQAEQGLYIVPQVIDSGE